MAEHQNEAGAHGAGNSSDRLRADIEQLQRDFSKLRGDVGDVVSTLVDVSKSGAGTARDRLDSGLQDLKGHLATVKDKSGEVVDAAGKKIQERPITSVLIALGIGLLIGKLLDRRGD